MLLDKDLGEITKEQREFIEKTYKSNERMIILINDLLNVTRIEEGRFLYKPVLARIEDVVQFVVNSRKEAIKKKKIKFKLKKPKKKIPLVKIDVEKIRLAIENFLENAIRYTPAGGKVTISLNYDKKKKEAEFKIEDTGIGIPENQKERVFTKFFRAANAVRTETEGSGLGLYIAKNIIEAHGGKIWFKSKEGKGTTFFFTLPVSK
jgi:signal transduction histidine kinase